ncbi:MAG: transporter [Caulobacter sp.]|nr:transporter [Caulobacter sp.]
MLKGIDPLLGPDLLSILRAMGHGDEIAIVDANFPAATLASRLCRCDGIGAERLLGAILTVLPLDDFVPSAAFRMAVIGSPDDVPPVARAFAGLLRDAGYDGPVEALERGQFYERASRAFAVVATGERQLYGNLILTKGVVRTPDP